MGIAQLVTQLLGFHSSPVRLRLGQIGGFTHRIGCHSAVNLRQEETIENGVIKGKALVGDRREGRTRSQTFGFPLAKQLPTGTP